MQDCNLMQVAALPKTSESTGFISAMQVKRHLQVAPVLDYSFIPIATEISESFFQALGL